MDEHRSLEKCVINTETETKWRLINIYYVFVVTQQIQSLRGKFHRFNAGQF